MRKKPGIFFLLLITILSFAGLASGKPVPVNTGKSEHSHVIEQRQQPNAELEREQVTQVFVYHPSLKKNLILPGQGSESGLVISNSLTLYKGKEAAVPAEKAYLFHIHPTHTHW